MTCVIWIMLFSEIKIFHVNFFKEKLPIELDDGLASGNMCIMSFILSYTRGFHSEKKIFHTNRFRFK